MNREERDFHFAFLEREETLLKQRIGLLQTEAALLTEVIRLRDELKTKHPRRRMPAGKDQHAIHQLPKARRASA